MTRPLAYLIAVLSALAAYVVLVLAGHPDQAQSLGVVAIVFAIVTAFVEFIIAIFSD
jgi:hypothetical protein